MIPDHLIDKAVHAASAGWVQHEQYQRDRTRKQVAAALEAVAADIWDQGERAGKERWNAWLKHRVHIDRPNPYRASEGA